MRQISALFLFAAISILSAVCPADARGDRGTKGVITAIDSSGHTFTCHWESDNWTYRVSGDTTYYVNGTQVVSFADLKIDGTIEVEYHEDGGARIADRVVLVAQ